MDRQAVTRCYRQRTSTTSNKGGPSVPFLNFSRQQIQADCDTVRSSSNADNAFTVNNPFACQGRTINPNSRLWNMGLLFLSDSPVFGSNAPILKMKTQRLPRRHPAGALISNHVSTRKGTQRCIIQPYRRPSPQRRAVVNAGFSVLVRQEYCVILQKGGLPFRQHGRVCSKSVDKSESAMTQSSRRLACH